MVEKGLVISLEKYYPAPGCILCRIMEFPFTVVLTKELIHNLPVKYCIYCITGNPISVNRFLNIVI
jgi:hypothetical protein